MTQEQKHALIIRDTDIDGVLRRFGEDEQLYISCLKMFLDDPTIHTLNEAIKASAWDDAFTAAHALKGLAGNLGFVPFMHSIGQLVILIRGGRTKELSECMLLVNSHYRDITDAIKYNFLSTK